MTVYGKIENGQFVPAPYGDVDYLVGQGYKPFDEDLHVRLNTNPQQVIIQGDKLVDITNTADYKARVTEREKIIRIVDLQAQIDELDKKRTRAGFEPSVKDGSSGQTWLEYYTSQIQDLRTQLSSLA